jgi:hypothetical protein
MITRVDRVLVAAVCAALLAKHEGQNLADHVEEVIE